MCHRCNKQARPKYVYWRNKVVSLNRSSVKTYFDNKCNSASGDAKTFFNAVSPYMSDKHFRNGNKIILREDDSIITDPAHVVDIFNVYF